MPKAKPAICDCAVMGAQRAFSRAFTAQSSLQNTALWIVKIDTPIVSKQLRVGLRRRANRTAKSGLRNDQLWGRHGDLRSTAHVNEGWEIFGSLWATWPCAQGFILVTHSAPTVMRACQLLARGSEAHRLSPGSGADKCGTRVSTKQAEFVYCCFLEIKKKIVVFCNEMVFI